MTVAALDRLVHQATILEMNVESYRRMAADSAREGRLKAEANGKQTGTVAMSTGYGVILTTVAPTRRTLSTPCTAS
jgi:hypothetical protein